MPDIEYSTSDYHHVRPLALTKTCSTRHFPQAKSKGHGRHVSRFTIISNVAETEQSYDPFKASRPQHLDSIRSADRAKITVHRTRPSTNENNQSIDGTTIPRQFSRVSGSVASGSEHGRYQKLAPPRAFTSHSSLASSTRSRSSALQMRVPIRHKRGVSFSYVRKRSDGYHRHASRVSPGAARCHSSHTEVKDNEGDFLHPMGGSPAATRYVRSRKGQSIMSQPLLSVGWPTRNSQLWTDDVRQLSSSLAKDCDEAFNRSSVISNGETQRRNSKTLSSFEPSLLAKQPVTPIRAPQTTPSKMVKLTSLNSRPLPPPPTRSDSVKIELMEARIQAELRKTTDGDESPGYLDRMVSHIDRLIEPLSLAAAYPDHRASSAPVDSKHAVSSRPLPSIYEARKEEDSPRRATEFDKYMDQHQWNEVKSGRNVSAPEARISKGNRIEDRFTRPDSNIRDTIRVVNPPPPVSPVQIPAPLTIRKKSSQGGKLSPQPEWTRTEPDKDRRLSKPRHSGLDLRQEYLIESKLDIAPDPGRIDDGEDKFANDSNSGTIVKKKSTWFKRSSKSEDEHDWKMSIGGGHAIASQPSSNDTARLRLDAPLPFLPKKKGFSFGRLFRRRHSNGDMRIGGTHTWSSPISSSSLTSISGNDMSDESDEESAEEAQRQSYSRRKTKDADLKFRQIEPQRSWIAKLFNVKPASKFICFSVSKRKARHEISKILREWKRYGIRNVQVDKERNVVFGRVAAKNCRFMSTTDFEKWSSADNFRPGFERGCLCRRDHDGYRAWQAIPSEHCTLYAGERRCQ
jgi:serine/threonine-protein kinase HSL1, negative regulator of Swe1 kinase